jgi:small subunit ribosomal protein S4
MLKYKCTLCRRANKKLYLKGSKCFTTKCPVVSRFDKGDSKKRNRGDYALQLREKQNTSIHYLMSASSFKRLHSDFTKQRRKDQKHAFVTALELKLYNVLYRGNLALSRRNAKQLVIHRFVLLNGRVVTIPSMAVKLGDRIALVGDASERLKSLTQQLSSTKRTIPSWLERSEENELTVNELPTPENTTIFFNEQMITEYYSR